MGGWVGPDLTRNFFFLNRPKIAVLIFWSSIPSVRVSVCIYIAKSGWLL